ncbi:hypothetical protein ACFW15_17155, partial [Streptomyces sp. NPDC058953]
MNKSLTHGPLRTESDIDGDVATEDFAEDVEADLLELRRLIETTVTKYRNWMAQDSLITAVGADRESIADSARQLGSEATESRAAAQQPRPGPHRRGGARGGARPPPRRAAA